MAKELKYDVYISYTRVDTFFVQELASHLVSRGISLLYDITNLSANFSFADTLAKAIRNSKFFILVMSPSYFKSEWAKLELELAMTSELESNKLKILPILIEDCELPPLLKSKAYLDLRSKRVTKQNIAELLEVIEKQQTPLLTTRWMKKTGNMSMGFKKRDLGKSELKGLIEELQTKVDSFTENSENDFSNLKEPKTQIVPNLCFVIMPFGLEDLDDTYKYFIKPSIENKCGLICQRGDDVFGSNVIMEDIRKSINKARVIIADLTGRNPNVFYEVGIAHTLKKDVLLLSQNMDDIPFDLRHRRVLMYDFTPKGCKKLEKSIAESINTIINGDA